MRGNGTIGAMTFDLHWKSLQSWVGGTILASYRGYNAAILFQNLQMGGGICIMGRSIPLSKHSTHYGSQTGSPCYNLTSPPSMMKAIYIHQLGTCWAGLG
jgi:hypothetical protein